MICCPSAVNKCPFKRNYYSIFGKECLVYGNIMCCPFRMYCLAPYTVPLGPTKTVRDGASSHKIDFVTRVKDNINVKKYHNCIIGSKVTAIMLNGWILLKKAYLISITYTFPKMYKYLLFLSSLCFILF